MFLHPQKQNAELKNERGITTGDKIRELLDDKRSSPQHHSGKETSISILPLARKLKFYTLKTKPESQSRLQIRDGKEAPGQKQNEWGVSGRSVTKSPPHPNAFSFTPLQP